MCNCIEYWYLQNPSVQSVYFPDRSTFTIRNIGGYNRSQTSCYLKQRCINTTKNLHWYLRWHYYCSQTETALCPSCIISVIWTDTSYIPLGHRFVCNVPFWILRRHSDWLRSSPRVGWGTLSLTINTHLGFDLWLYLRGIGSLFRL